MKILLSPDVERLIAERVSSGRYHSADEVVREGLELLQERENEAQRSPSNHAADFAEAFESIARDVSDADSKPSRRSPPQGFRGFAKLQPRPDRNQRNGSR